MMGPAPFDPNLPQPPPPGQTPPATGPSGLTLGQAANPVAAPTSDPLPAMNNYLQQYERILQATRQAIEPAKTQPLPPEPGPNLLQSLGSFGIANLVHHANEQSKREFNAGAEAYNKKLEMQAALMAQKMVDSKASSDALSGRAGLEQLGMQLRVLGFQNQMTDLQRKVFNDAWNRAYKGTTGVPTPGQLEGGEATGNEFVPAPGMPGRFKLQPKAGGGWDVPPDSPMGKALTTTGGGASVAGAAAPVSAPRRPDESQADYAARRKIEQQTAGKLAVPTSPTRTRAETAPKVLQLVQDARADMQKAAGVGFGIGPGASRYRSAKAFAGFDDPTFVKYQDTVGALHSLLMSMHTGSRSSEMLLKKFEKMVDPSKQSVANMNAGLDMIERYARQVAHSGGQALPEELDKTGTPTTTTPPSTGAPTQPTGATGVTPGGVRFRVVQ